MIYVCVFIQHSIFSTFLLKTSYWWCDFKKNLCTNHVRVLLLFQNVRKLRILMKEWDQSNFSNKKSISENILQLMCTYILSDKLLLKNKYLPWILLGDQCINSQYEWVIWSNFWIFRCGSLISFELTFRIVRWTL